MKSKNIPADIKSKSIKEAQNEIKEIITNLEESMNKYNRMIELNYHIQGQFKKKLKEIKRSDFNNDKKSIIKD